MQVAARIAEVVSGKSWTQLFTERIAAPLGMTSTFWYPSTTNPRIGGGSISTLGDYARLMSMLAAEGEYNGAQVLQSSTVAEMQEDQTNGAAIAYSPHPDGRRYGIGEWRDLVDGSGNVIQLSSQGRFGFSPWLDVQRGYYAIFFVQNQLYNVYVLVNQLQNAIRAIIDAPDSDGDGCSDSEELGLSPALGGGRNPLDPLDFPDLDSDRVITILDITAEAVSFLQAPSPPALDLDGDGTITILDLAEMADQFLHSCGSPP